MTNPIVSVIVPVYNKAKTVDATLRAALDQTAQDYEILVIDDGSTDDSAARVQAIGDPRIRIIHQSNSGVSVARNRGIEEARADWVALLDADDHWDRDHLAQLTQALQHSRSVAVFSNHRLETRPHRPAIDPYTPPQRIFDFFGFALANGGYPIGTSSIAIRRAEAIDCGGFAAGRPMGEDTDFWCRLSCRGPFDYTGRLTVIYNDAPTPDGVARNLSIPAYYPPFAEHFPQMVASGAVPAALVGSGRRYVNFLLLEYVRQLIDRGDYQSARRVLLRECVLSMDPSRYWRRLMRTLPLGRLVYRLARRPSAAIALASD